MNLSRSHQNRKSQSATDQSIFDCPTKIREDRTFFRAAECGDLLFSSVTGQSVVLISSGKRKMKNGKRERLYRTKPTPPRGGSELREKQSGHKTSRYETKRLFLSHIFIFSYFNDDVHLTLLTFTKRGGKIMWLRLELHLKQLVMKSK